MTAIEARIRRRLFGCRDVQVFEGDGGAVFMDDEVVRVREGRRCLHVWTLWEDEVRAWSFPWTRVTEYRVTRTR